MHRHGGAARAVRRGGAFGHAAAFSLQGQKTLTGGEGGYLATDDTALYRRALAFGHYNKRCKVEIPPDDPLYPYHVTGMGLKLRIHPLAAAIAEQQLAELEGVLAGRQRLAGVLREALADVPGLMPQAVPGDVTPSWYAFPMAYDEAALGGLPITEFLREAHAEGCVELDRPLSAAPLSHPPLFQAPAALFPGYAGRVACRPEDFPGADVFHARVLKLPVWHRREDEPLVRAYAAALRKVAEHHAARAVPGR
ncbi:MAG: DegT/DnrJ/EryC1/StrS family aminotransferase [Candidatus Sericytochromatia bacterium]|nr:DegT/DnrJ/EryC1/StrS family aminotransferase [Candidatus Sericytochromatia bacterium]